ncbi:MerR family transcriptional regulator [Microbacterium timonense]|uniref:MerR family transcriptional regulator n=1 Tax=Microbacterium timonense TaxID=2086576 RepID=UPI000D10B7B9|nr:MerR family transcriptional regulator [Microbacterium timonense]
MAGAEASPPYSTAAVARLAGYSVQQVRDLEQLGVIPPATRRANGYRSFGAEHVLALRAYRALAAAVGPVQARATLRDARTLPADEALARVGALHVGLARARDDTLAALRALDAISREAAGEATPAPDDAMGITELATALGVRSSTLRFWEQEGLLFPERITHLHVRHYPPEVVRQARIIAALRAAGYRVPDVRAAMESLRGLSDSRVAREALQTRLDDIASRWLALLRAGADVAELVAPGSAAST